jgi:hypothetical protein
VRRFSQFIALLTVGALSPTNASADQIVNDRSDAARERERPSIVVPFAFSTETMKSGVGAMYLRKGVFQPEDSLFLTGYGTSNSSFGLFGGLTNLQLTKRLFFNPTVGAMLNEQQRFYGDLGYDANVIPSGSNDSDESEYISAPDVSLRAPDRCWPRATAT